MKFDLEGDDIGVIRLEWEKDDFHMTFGAGFLRASGGLVENKSSLVVLLKLRQGYYDHPSMRCGQWLRIVWRSTIAALYASRCRSISK